MSGSPRKAGSLSSSGRRDESSVSSMSGAATVPDKARASLHKRALEWLRADLAGRTRQLKGDSPLVRAEVRLVLHIWRSDPALAGVRDAGRLAALPSEERAAWQQFWADVAALAAKARDGK